MQRKKHWIYTTNAETNAIVWSIKHNKREKPRTLVVSV